MGGHLWLSAVGDEGWEARMSARAKDRERVQRAVSRVAEAREWDARIAEGERLGMAYRAGMTLGGAMALLNGPRWACACVGPPHCCRFSFIQAKALHRGAHVVVKLFADVVTHE